MNKQLFAYLGLTQEGELALYVSTGRLNPVGTRIEKGTPLPVSTGDMMSGVTPGFEGIDWEHAIKSLHDLQEYFNNQVKDKKRK